MSYQADTQVFQVNPRAIDETIIRQAGQTIRQGGLVAFPTETVYGLGANAFDEGAVGRIFAAKGRPSNDPLIVHIYTLRQLYEVAVDLPEIALDFAERFWAGPLTLVLKRSRRVAPNVSGGLDTVAVRMPSHPIAQALLQAAGVPVAAPSANLFSRPSPTTAAHVLEDLTGRVDIVLDGGTTPIGLESTVLDLTHDPPRVLRPGGILLEQIQVIAPATCLAAQYVGSDGNDSEMASPGMMVKHYSPRAEVQVFQGEAEKIIKAMQACCREYATQGKTIGVMVPEEQRQHFLGLPCLLVSLGSTFDFETIARNLFAALRHLDQQGVDVILTPAVAQQGLGLAIWDRLIRAAEGKVIEVD
jgi:L-threonylcarbamoyladenylate synthase